MSVALYTCTEPTVPPTPCCTPGAPGCYAGAYLEELADMDCLAAVDAIGPGRVRVLAHAALRDGVDPGVFADTLARKAGL